MALEIQAENQEPPTEATSEGFSLDNLSALIESSDADLEAALAQGMTEPDSETDEQTETEQTPPPQDAKPPEQPKQQDDVNTVRLSKEEWSKIQQQLDQKERFIKQRNNQVGEQRKEIKELRNQLEQRNQQLQAALEDADDLKTAFAINKEIASNEQRLNEIDAADQQLSRSEQMEQFVQRAQQVVTSMVPQEDLNWNAMADTLRRDGLPEQAVQQIMANPFASSPPETIIHLAKRTKAENMLGILAHAYKQEREKAAQLEQQLQNAGANTLARVQSALKKPPQMNGGSGGAKPKSSVPFDPQNLSDDELEAALREAAGV